MGQRSIEIRKEGRRLYFAGAPYEARGALKSAGAKWDSDARMWWMGVTKRAEAEALVERLASMPTPEPDGTTASPAKLRDGSWGARVRGEVEPGDTITITTRAGKSWEARVTEVVWSRDGVSIVATESLDGGSRRRNTPAPRPPRQPSLVGERGELTSQFEASRADRAPHREIGEACYLRAGSERIAVVVVGYQPARYVRSDEAEDMGHFGVASGWYGTLYYRRANEEEAVALAGSPAEVARREQEAADALRAERLRELDGLMGADDLTEDRVPAGSHEIKPTAADKGIIWRGAAGHRALYLGADGAAWRTQSSYDDIPRAWRTEDPRAVELATLLAEVTS